MSSARGGLILYNSSLVGSTASQVQQWIGGRSQISICATQYGTGVNVQVQGLGPAANWIPICSSFVADQLFSFDAPPGNYRVVGAGSSVSLSVGIIGVSYN